jgi:hypothetical protein
MLVPPPATGDPAHAAGPLRCGSTDTYRPSLA